MSHLQKCLMFGTLKILECRRLELNFEFLHDHRHGKVNDEKN